MLVAVCVALSNGLMQNWLPPEHVKSLQIPELNGENASPGDKPGKKANLTNAAHPSSKPFVLSNEAQADIKKALDVVDYAMQVTNGDNLSNVVTLKDRFPLIKTWVLAKQLNQSAIKNYGIVKSNSVINISRLNTLHFSYVFKNSCFVVVVKFLINFNLISLKYDF